MALSDVAFCQWSPAGLMKCRTPSLQGTHLELPEVTSFRHGNKYWLEETTVWQKLLAAWERDTISVGRIVYLRNLLYNL